MKKICIAILTTKGGQGLISGSVAIKQHFEDIDSVPCHVEIIDFFEHGNIAGKLLTGIYNLLLKKSLRLNALFIRLIHALRVDRWRLFYKTTDRFLLSLLDQNRPDIIIITSEYIVHYITVASERLSLTPLIYVANIDPGNKCVPLWFHPGVQMHILPTSDTMECYRDYGFPREKAKVAGLLVRKEFLSVHDSSKRALAREMGLFQEDFTVLFAGSREGYSGITPLIKKLAGNTNFQIVVVCGKNHSMQNTLQELKDKHGWNMKVLGWRNDMHKLMRIADVIVSKPGKQTMKEAVSCRVPMISIAYPSVMEQEIGNIEFMKKRGIGLVAENDAEVIRMIKQLEQDKVLYEELVEKISRAAEEIKPAEVVKAIIDNYRLSRDGLGHRFGQIRNLDSGLKCENPQ